MATAPRRLTLEEFLQLPEEKPALEYFDGVVSQKMSPKFRHSVLQSELLEQINRIGRRERTARAFPELRSTYAGESTVPDVSVYRWERIKRDEAGEVADDVFDPPDIAIEITSPGQSVNALFRRCRWYASNGVEIALLVDPADRSVLAFLRDGTVHDWRGADRIDLTAVIPGFDLTVERLFDSLSE
jgi:Uma2 family endonuclease